MKDIRLQAHRGVSSEYPEDTIAAFRAAIEEGYKIIELDPKFTVDGHCVILHDRTLTRTARKNGKAPETEMKIAEITLEEARSWEYGSWMDPKFEGEKIPTLDEIVELISNNDLPFKFDNVWEKFTESEQETMLGTLERANLGKKLGFTCQRLDTFEKVAKRFPEAELHWDGDLSKETLDTVKSIAGNHRLTLWVCYENELSDWFTREKASVALCNRVREYGEVGIWILSKKEELARAILEYDADAVETTGHIKPEMIDEVRK